MQKKQFLSIAAVAILCAILLFLVASRSSTEHGPTLLDESPRFEKCQARVFEQLAGKEELKVSLFNSIASHCYLSINDEDLLSEAGLRRLALLNQQVQMPILMWLVIAITLSGVGLAGLQLWAAYRLALVGRGALEQGGQLSVEASKVTLNSSVTGLLVLLISLAFFYIFVQAVYLIKEGPLSGPDMRLSGTALTQRAGGLGMPPAPSGPSR